MLIANLRYYGYLKVLGGTVGDMKANLMVRLVLAVSDLTFHSLISSLSILRNEPRRAHVQKRRSILNAVRPGVAGLLSY